MINPMKLLKMKEMGERFRANHPRIPEFLEAAFRSVREGSVIEMTVKDPEGRTICANIRVCADDMEMLRELQELSKES